MSRNAATLKSQPNQASLFDADPDTEEETPAGLESIIADLNDAPDEVPDEFKTDEELNQEMEEEEGGEFEDDDAEVSEDTPNETNADPSEQDSDSLKEISDQIKELSNEDTVTAESFQKMIELQAAFNSQFEQRVQKQLDAVASDFKERTDLVINEMQSVQKAYERQTSGIRNTQNKLSRVMMNVERGGEWAEGLNKAVTNGAVEAVTKTADTGVKSIQSTAQKSAMAIDKLEQAAIARSKRFMRVTKPEIIVNIATWIAVALATAIIIAFCYEFFQH